MQETAAAEGVRRAFAQNKLAGNERSSLIAGFDALPDDAMVSTKIAAAVEGCGESSVWRRMADKTDDYPKGIKLSTRCTRLRVGDLRAYWRKRAAVKAEAVAV